ncbi:hypothetical protein C1646_681828 [Rhizophagus diaphanus]|nr:hypothetical protein C1646_681828 [Rhizophagus diaphanus] [Rhizophagus sp. MUCL 43196]
MDIKFSYVKLIDKFAFLYKTFSFISTFFMSDMPGIFTFSSIFSISHSSVFTIFSGDILWRLYRLYLFWTSICFILSFIQFF